MVLHNCPWVQHPCTSAFGLCMSEQIKSYCIPNSVKGSSIPMFVHGCCIPFLSMGVVSHVWAMGVPPPHFSQWALCQCQICLWYTFPALAIQFNSCLLALSLPPPPHERLTPVLRMRIHSSSPPAHVTIRRSSPDTPFQQSVNL